MSIRVRRIALIFIVVFAVAQLFRPSRANPPTDPARTIQAHKGATVAAVLNRSCGDCHSNQTEWRWYTSIAPASWLMVYSVREGRKTVNFSEWSGYPPEQQRRLLEASCKSVSEGKMPGVYTWLRPDTKLSRQDVETICAASRQADALPASSR